MRRMGRLVLDFLAASAMTVAVFSLAEWVLFRGECVYTRVAHDVFLAGTIGPVLGLALLYRLGYRSKYWNGPGIFTALIFDFFATIGIIVGFLGLYHWIAESALALIAVVTPALVGYHMFLPKKAAPLQSMDH